MSDCTHADLLAACQRARPPLLNPTAAEERLAAHVDDIEATLRRHTVGTIEGGDALCVGCKFMRRWPCPDIEQAADRLRTWGALE